MIFRRLTDQLNAVVTQNMTEAGLNGKDPHVTARRHIILYGYSNSLLFNLTSGAFLTGFWLALGADADWISMVIMLASVANMLQLFAPFLLQRVRDTKQTVLHLRLIQHTLNLVAAAIIPLLGLAEPLMLRLVLVMVFIAYILGALAGPGLQIWHLKSIPPERRLGFFSFLHATNVIITFSAMFLGGLFTDGLTAAVSSRFAFILLRLLLLAVAVFDLWNLRKIDNPGVPGEIVNRRRQGLLDLPRHILSHPVYLLTILSASLWAMASSMPGQYFVVYLVSDLGYSYSLITGVSLLNLVVIIFLTPLWKRVIARLAWMRSFAFSTFLYAAGLIAMAFVGMGRFGLPLYVLSSFYTYIMALGINLSFANLTYVNMPDENQTSFVSLFNASFHGAILLGIWLGNRFMRHPLTGDGGPVWLGLVNAQLLLLTAAAAILISGFLIWQIGRVEKPIIDH